MYTDSVSIKLLGISETEVTQSDLREKVNNLFNEAPYSSALKAMFVQRGMIIKGVITIYTSRKRFFAKASGQNLNEVIHKLTDVLRKQFKPYKRIKIHKNWNSLINFNKSKKVRSYDFNDFGSIA